MRWGRGRRSCRGRLISPTLQHITTTRRPFGGVVRDTFDHHQDASRHHPSRACRGAGAARLAGGVRAGACPRWRTDFGASGHGQHAMGNGIAPARYAAALPGMPGDRPCGAVSLARAGPARPAAGRCRIADAGDAGGSAVSAAIAGLAQSGATRAPPRLILTDGRRRASATGIIAPTESVEFLCVLLF